MSVAAEENTPKWLEALENKRKQRSHKLAHEIGAGAPCLVCSDKCKGLNLHFWRKICIECKCRKEDHDIGKEEDDYAQFEILFGAKKVKRTLLKFDDQTKSFDWIPPNVSSDLVVDYLKSIPVSKLPISNSEGARYRKQQLEKQIPLHDVDPETCHGLSVTEMEEFNKYLTNLKNNVIGQGKIIKYKSHQPIQQKIQETYVHDLLHEGNYMKANSEEYRNLKPQMAELKAFLSRNKNSENKIHSDLSKSDFYAEGSVRSLSKDCYPFRAQEKNEGPSGNFKSVFKDIKPFPNLMCNKKPTNNSGTYGESDRWNNNDGSSQREDSNGNKNEEKTKNEGVSHTGNEQKVHLEVGGKIQELDAAFYNDSLGTLGLNQLQISVTNVPFIPVQEADTLTSRKKKGNNYTNDTHMMSPNKEDDLEYDEFPSPPATCVQCLSILNPEEVVVQTDRGGTTSLWHAHCFVCHTCKELLVDLMYFFHNGRVYCGRHYAATMNIPRCYACDELIFMKEYTCAEGESYHVKHFCCFYCDVPLAGKQYIPKDSNPVCLDCYQLKYGKKCHTCCRPITAGEQRISWQQLDFHVSADCFICHQCKKNLLGGKFVVKDNQVFCSKNCVLEFAH